MNRSRPGTLAAQVRVPEPGRRSSDRQFRRPHEKNPQEIVKAVSAALADFIGRVRPQDDRTMVVVKMGQ